MKFNGILLDIDNALYPYQPIHQKALSAVFTIFSKELSIDEDIIKREFKKARDGIHIELSGTASSHNRLLYFQRMFEQMKINPMKYGMYAYNIYWDIFLENLKPYDNVYDFLELVRDRKVCLLSDLTAHIQYRKIERLRLYDYTDLLVTSEEAGREKPHPYMFMLGLKKLGLKADEVCMVGDSFEKDITGAANLGIYSFWLNPDGKEEKLHELTTEFRTFKELMGYFV